MAATPDPSRPGRPARVGRRGPVLLVVVLGLAVLAAGAVWALGLSARSSLTIGEVQRVSLPPNRAVFCSFVTRTGAREILAESPTSKPPTNWASLVRFADAIADRAPDGIAADAHAVAAEARAIQRSHRPASAAAVAAARRVDAYAAAHC